MTSRLVTLAIWLVAVAGGLAWLLPLVAGTTPVPPQAVLAEAVLPPLAAGAERLLGSPPVQAEAAPTPADGRYKLIGVIAPRRGGAAGLALIAVDGQPPRPFRVGREVDPGTRVLAVAQRSVELGPSPGARTITLELPALPEPGRGAAGTVPPPVPSAMPMPAGARGTQAQPPAIAMPSPPPVVGEPGGFAPTPVPTSAAPNLLQ